MKKKLQQLTVMLDDLAELYNQLKKTALEKQEALTSGDIEKLKKTTSQEEFTIVLIGRIDRKCRSLQENLAAENRIPVEEFNLTRLIKVLKGEPGKELMEKQSRLQQLIDELMQVNKDNQRLIEQSLAYVDYSLKIISRTIDQGTYSEKNPKPVVKDLHLLDKKV